MYGGRKTEFKIGRRNEGVEVFCVKNNGMEKTGMILESDEYNRTGNLFGRIF